MGTPLADLNIEEYLEMRLYQIGFTPEQVDEIKDQLLSVVNIDASMPRESA